MDNTAGIWILVLMQVIKGCISQLVVDVGGGVTYTAGEQSIITVSYTPAEDFINIEWFYNSEAAANLMGRVFVEEIADPSKDVVTDPAYGGRASFGFTTAARPVRRSMTLSISAMLLEDDGKVILIKAFETFPKSVTVPLNVSECTRFTGSSIIANESGCTAYQYNCKTTFGCDSRHVGPTSFDRTCGGNAEWDNSTNECVPALSFAPPSSDCATAVGSRRTISTSITDGTPISASYMINWNDGMTPIASYGLTAAGPGPVTLATGTDFQGRISVNGTAVSDMRIIIDNLTLSDNGKVVSVSAMYGSIEAGSSNTTLQVSECPKFSDASPVSESCNPYHFDCTTTFKCSIAGNIFTAKCLCNATFDSKSNCACCPRLDVGKQAAIGLGSIYFLLVLVVVIISVKRKPKSSDHPSSVELETSGSTQLIVFKYEGKVKKRTLKIDAGQYPNGSTSAIDEQTITQNYVGRLSWSPDGYKNQAYKVLVLRDGVVVDEMIVIGGSYMHWMASSCEYTYVIIPIGKGQIGKPVKHKTKKKRFIKNFWALLFFIFSLILIIIGVALLASSPNSDCCKNNCDPCSLSPTGSAGLGLAILAILMLVILLIWMLLESCCPSGCLCCIACACLMCACCCCYCCKPKEKEEGSGNSIYMNTGAGRVSPKPDGEKPTTT